MTNPSNKGRSKYKTPLAKYMQDNGISDGELATLASCDRRTIINMKIGGRGHNSVTIRNVAKATGLPIEALV